MNREQKDRFLKRVEAKYITSQTTIDPWKNKPDKSENNQWRVISESEIFQSIKNIRGVMMFPGTYEVEYPTGNTFQPWGPTVTFNYIAEPALNNLSKTGPNQTLINQVESMLNAKLSQYIHAIGTDYDGEDANGKGIYSITITQKTQK